ncbi:hypothetical protein [Sphingomonas sp. DBB INV C78]|uniref:hypothetical protein n=1 Tax=Sphingomonas sp. DBB INV C78 TaxID=3349434 RepID=UPI0036D3B54A
MRRHIYALALVTACLAAPAVANGPTLPTKLAKMEAADFRKAAIVEDDNLEFHAMISTREGFRKSQKMTGTSWGDNHLVARIDKRSGATEYEVHQFVRYLGSRRTYGAVQFEGADGNLVARKVDQANHGDDICPNSDFNGDCSLTKNIVFKVDENLLKSIAGRSGGWDYKFKSDKVEDLRATLSPAEAEGLLMAVADYRARTSRQASR